MISQFLNISVYFFKTLAEAGKAAVTDQMYIFLPHHRPTFENEMTSCVLSQTLYIMTVDVPVTVDIKLEHMSASVTQYSII